MFLYHYSYRKYFIFVHISEKRDPLTESFKMTCVRSYAWLFNFLSGGQSLDCFCSLMSRPNSVK